MDIDSLRTSVRTAYSSAAEQPEAPDPFPVGRTFAESLGNPEDLLRRMPSVSVDAFTGVSNLSCLAGLPRNGTLLDLGCGADLDALILAHRMHGSGRVAGIDFSTSMLARARTAAEQSGLDNILLCEADAERLPFNDGSLDAAVVNGILNLNPARDAVFRELARTVRAGGCVYAAKLILREPLPAAAENAACDWFA